MSTTTGARSTAAGGQSTTAPPQVRLLGSGARRWRWLGLGLAIMVTGALAGVVAVDRINERQEVLVAAGDLAAGDVLTTSDLKVTRISGAEEVSVIPEDQLEEAVGSTLTVPVPEGGVLAESAVGASADYPGDGSAVVGAVLAPGRFPASLQRGAQVSVVVVDDSASPITSDSGGGNDAENNESSEQSLTDSSGVTAYPARVESVANTETEGSVNVELVVDAEAAAQVSAAAATERATVVQVQAGGQD